MARPTPPLGRQILVSQAGQRFPKVHNYSGGGEWLSQQPNQEDPMIVYRPIPPLTTGRSNSLWSAFAAMASAALLGPAWPSGGRRLEHQEAGVSTPRR
jgi:hypothetical protein